MLRKYSKDGFIAIHFWIDPIRSLPAIALRYQKFALLFLECNVQQEKGGRKGKQTANCPLGQVLRKKSRLAPPAAAAAAAAAASGVAT